MFPGGCSCDRNQCPDVFCIPLARQSAGSPEADAPIFPAYGAISEFTIVLDCR